MSQTTQAPCVAIPPDVLAFAARQAVSPFLPAVLELTNRVFPTAEPTVRLDDDPELPGDRHILFEVEVPLDVSQAIAAQRDWNDGLFRCCPAPQVCVFRLSMELVPG